MTNFAHMFHFRLRVILCISLAFLLHSRTLGQEGKKWPVTVLVQLQTEQNRINALIKSKRYTDLEVFRTDVKSAMLATLNDFWNHFDYCPVYYYLDTNIDAVLDRRFNGVLLDEHLAPVANLNLTDTSTNYLIVYYGHPVWQSNKRKWDTTKLATMGGNPNGRGLVICDYKMRQVHYLYNLDFDFFNYNSKRNKNPFKYVSKKFKIEYLPFAAELNRKLGAPRKNWDKIITDEDITFPFFLIGRVR